MFPETLDYFLVKNTDRKSGLLTSVTIITLPPPEARGLSWRGQAIYTDSDIVTTVRIANPHSDHSITAEIDAPEEYVGQLLPFVWRAEYLVAGERGGMSRLRLLLMEPRRYNTGATDRAYNRSFARTDLRGIVRGTMFLNAPRRNIQPEELNGNLMLEALKESVASDFRKWRSAELWQNYSLNPALGWRAKMAISEGIQTMRSYLNEPNPQRNNFPPSNS